MAKSPRKSNKRSRSSPAKESANKASATTNATGTRPTAADARASTERIEKTIVGHGSFITYLSQLVRFVIFIFDNYQQYLTQPHLAAMKEADEKDKETNNTDRTALRNAIIHAVDAIKPQHNGSDHNCFLKIDGDGDLPYKVVLEYMQTKFNYVEVDRSSAIAYLKELKLSTDITPEMEVDNDKVRLKVFQSYEQYSGIRSAVLWIYKLARVESPFQSNLASYLKGVSRHIQAAKQNLGLKLTKGKASMKPEAFELIAKHLFESGDKRDVFCHLMFLLDWNLMKRAENCVHAQMIHIEFENDYLKFTFEKEKGRQHGDVHGPWHCFANPEKPHICLVLAFAKYIFTFSDILQEGKPLFPGTNQYSRYSNRMLQLYCHLKNDLFSMGIDWKELGTHSARKGVGSMVANASTVGPPIVALCLRIGWSLGGVKDKYLFRQDAGDLNVGRRAAGLDVETTGFAISPPYFDYSDLDEAEKLRELNKLDKWLKDRIPKTNLIPATTWNLVKQCFASLCYHYDDLCKNLDKACLLRHSPVFRDLAEAKEFRNRAKTAFPWNSTMDTPQLNGIPPYVLHIAKMEELEKKIEQMENNVVDRITGAMEERGFSSTAYKAQDIKAYFSEIVEEYTKQIRGEMKELKEGLQTYRHVYRHVSAGAAEEEEDLPAVNTCTIVDEDDDMAAAAAEDDNDDDDDVTLNLEQRRLLKKRRLHKTAIALTRKRVFKVGFHHGTLNVLPHDFTFTSMTTLHLVNCWLLGDTGENVPALGTLKSKDVAHFESRNGAKIGNKVLGKMRAVMSIVEDYARERNVAWEKPNDWSAAKVTRMWDAISEDFNAAFCQTNRNHELSWSTVYSRMSDANVFSDRRKKLKMQKRVDANTV